MLAFSMVQTAVVPILPSLATGVHVSSGTVAWLMTANLLAAAVLTPLLGRFGDLYGRRTMLLVSLGGLALGSVLAVSTESFAWLVTARVLQGAGGGVLPLAISVVRNQFPPREVPAGIGAVSAAMGIGSALGLVVTGLLMEQWSYKSVFWAGLLISLVAIAWCTAGIPKDVVTDHTVKVDPLGALTLAGWLCALLLAVSQGNSWGWGSGRIIGLFIAATVIAATWTVIELKVPHPLVSIRMLVSPVVAITNAAGAVIGFGMYGCFMVISNFAQTPEKTAHYGFSADVLHAACDAAAIRHRQHGGCPGRRPADHHARSSDPPLAGRTARSGGDGLPRRGEWAPGRPLSRRRGVRFRRRPCLHGHAGRHQFRCPDRAERHRQRHERGVPYGRRCRGNGCPRLRPGQ